MWTLSDISACAGSNQLSEDCRQNRPVSRVFIHHGYNKRTFKNDIAMILLSAPFNLTDPLLARICLPSANSGSNYPSFGTTAVAIGWGKTELNSSLSNDLKEVVLKIMKESNDYCDLVISDKKVQICATASNKGKFFSMQKYKISTYYFV